MSAFLIEHLNDSTSAPRVFTTQAELERRYPLDAMEAERVSGLSCGEALEVPRDFSNFRITRLS